MIAFGGSGGDCCKSSFLLKINEVNSGVSIGECECNKLEKCNTRGLLSPMMILSVLPTTQFVLPPFGLQVKFTFQNV